MATNPDFYLDEEFIEDKAVNELLNTYNKKYKNAYELLPINVDYSKGNILSNFEGYKGKYIYTLFIFMALCNTLSLSLKDKLEITFSTFIANCLSFSTVNV